MPRQQIHFVTGRLAAPALKEVLRQIAPQLDFGYSIDVLNISVAALLSCAWVAPRLKAPPGTQRVMLPGYCQGDLQQVTTVCGLPVVRGPKDLRDLPGFLGLGPAPPPELSAYTIEILAEINHAQRYAPAELVRQAQHLRASGADIIDLGCTPGQCWSTVGQAVAALRAAGMRVSIDSMDRRETADAVAQGAELVLSVNSSNRQAAADWGCPVVAIPDSPEDWASLQATVEFLENHGVAYRIDPILEPIGFGFGRSLLRFAEARHRWPAAEMLMGVGNLSELTDVDSAGVNVLLLALCEEWGVRSVLTTQVINWCRTAVRECDLARRLVHYAIGQRRLPKHVEPRLVQLRDPQVWTTTAEQCQQLAGQLRDPNYRLFAGDDVLHAVWGGGHAAHHDPFELFAQLLARRTKPLSAEHAFYLGYELAQAQTARLLGKQYRQDEPLTWGHLTADLPIHRHAPADEAQEAPADELASRRPAPREVPLRELTSPPETEA